MNSRIRAAGDWHQVLTIDAHEMGAQNTYLFSPPREPRSPFVSDAAKRWGHIFAGDQARAFDDVVRNCARAPRPGDPGTWITDEMREAYGRLYRSGHAHSVETWVRDRLVGGLYGVLFGTSAITSAGVRPESSAVT